MLSSLNESVTLISPIEVSEIVEHWLEELSKKMVTTLQEELGKIQRFDGDKFQKFPSQIICLENEISFNRDTVHALQSNSVSTVKSSYQKSLSELTKKCHQTNDPLILSKIKSLILDQIHQISVLDLLKSANVSSVADWNWHKQLKFTQ